jgi:hypothetical protein
VPEKAIDCSNRALQTLLHLYSNDDNKRNQRKNFLSTTVITLHSYTINRITDLDVSKHPATTPFHRTDVDSNEYKIIVNTKPLFRNLPDPRNLAVSALPLSDLRSTSSVSLFYIATK